MADISKDQLRKEIAAILKDADLTSTSSKKVRQTLEEKLDCELQGRKKEIDDLVMEYVNKKEKSKGKKKAKSESEESEVEDVEEDEEEEEEEEDEESDEEPKKTNKRASSGKKPMPAKKAKKADSDASASVEEASDDDYTPKKGAKGGAKGRKSGGKKKKAGGSESDSDEEWSKPKKSAKKAGGGGAKRGGGGGGYMRSIKLSPELAAVVGSDSMARHEVVKKIWSIIKERNLYDPKNKQYAICDDELMKVFNMKRFRTFGMMKYLKSHFLD